MIMLNVSLYNKIKGKQQIFYMSCIEIFLRGRASIQTVISDFWERGRAVAAYGASGLHWVLQLP